MILKKKNVVEEILNFPKKYKMNEEDAILLRGSLHFTSLAVNFCNELGLEVELQKRWNDYLDEQSGH